MNLMAQNFWPPGAKCHLPITKEDVEWNNIVTIDKRKTHLWVTREIFSFKLAYKQMTVRGKAPSVKAVAVPSNLAYL